MFLYQFLSGTGAGSPYVHRIRNANASLIEFFSAYQSTSRASPLAQDIVKANVELRRNRTNCAYASDNCKLT